jgi:hypothetical protein
MKLLKQKRKQTNKPIIIYKEKGNNESPQHFLFLANKHLPFVARF